MKILLVCSSDGKTSSSIACLRTFKALKSIGADVKMLVKFKTTDDNDIIEYKSNLFVDIKNYFLKGISNIKNRIFKKSAQGLVQKGITIDYFGKNFINHPLVKEADLINFHWVRFGMINLDTLNQLTKQNKRIVYTMYDLNFFSGYIKEKNRPVLKLDVPLGDKIKFISSSIWLEKIVQDCPKLRKQNLVTIPTPIDTNVFKFQDKETAKLEFGITTKKVIAFGALNINSAPKGLNYMIEALNIIARRYPEAKKDITLLSFGKGNEKVLSNIPFQCYNARLVTDEKLMVKIYSCADVFVLPSLDEKISNSILESLSCGTPCVTFNTGTMGEVIEHCKNGMLAEPYSVEDLASCIEKIIFAQDYDIVCQNARNKIEQNFSFPVIGIKYTDLFRQLF